MKTLPFFMLFVFFLNTINAQNCCNDRWSFGANFTLTNPIEEMQSNAFRTNYGVTFNGLYNLNPQASSMNFHIGGRMSGGMSIGERNNIILEDPAGAAARSSVYNTLVDLHLLGRVVVRPDQKIQPYFDLFGGGRLLGANHDIKLKKRNFNYDRRTSDRIAQSANWAWGTGAGVYIHLNKNVYFDLGVNYTQSETQEFIDLNSVVAKDNIIDYQTVNSISNSIGIHIGFHFKIDCDQQQEQTFRDDSYEKRRMSVKRNKRTPKARTKTSNSSSGKN